MSKVWVGSTKRIVLYDTLIAKLDRDGLRFIMAHEMGHYVLGHIRILCLLSILTYTGAFWLANRLGNRLISRFKTRLGFQNLSELGAIPLLALFCSVFIFSSAPIFNLASRHTEREADRFGLEATCNNRASAMAFAKMYEENFGVPRPFFLAWDSPLFGRAN